MRNRVGNLLWGLFFILLGLGIAGRAFGYIQFSLYFNGWWTLFIIIPCTISLFKSGFRIVPLSGLLIGFILLARCQGYISEAALEKLIFPVILVVIGLGFIFHNHSHHKGCAYEGKGEKIRLQLPPGALEYAATFQGQKIRYDNEVFEGAVLNSIFGGIELHLESAVLMGDVMIDCCSIFGGITIWVPEGANIRVSGTPIFGGIDNHRRHCQQIPGAPVVYVNATCMFGGVDIK